MKKLFAILVFSCTFFVLQAQPKFKWAKNLQGDSFDFSASGGVAVDTMGNVYVAGYFDGVMDADPDTGSYILTSVGDLDMYVVKLDKAGKMQWAYSFGNAGTDGFLAITTDPAGNVYLAGAFSDSVDFDPGSDTQALFANSFYDICFLKLNGAGQFQWVSQMVGDDEAAPFSISLDNSGNIYATGYFTSQVDFDPDSTAVNLTASGYYDAFVCKLNPSGKYIWAKQFAGKSGFNFCFGRGVRVDASGNVFVTGNFDDSVDFNPGTGVLNLVSNGADDVFLVKLGSTGNYIWAKQIGGQDSETANSISLDGSNNPYITGSFSGIVDFDPNANTFNLTSYGGTDIYVLKLLGTTGAYSGVRRMGGTDYDDGYSIVHDAQNNIYIASTFEGTADHDPSTSTKNLNAMGNSDLSVVKLNSTMAFQWAQQFGGADAYMFDAFLAVNNGALYAAGSYYGRVDFNPGTDSFYMEAPNYNGYVVKLEDCAPTYSTVTASECKTYTLNGTTYTSSGTYTQKTTNSDGCDSNITLKLTIKNTTNTINASACKSYTINGQTYTATGAYTQTLNNAAGCDSILTINLTINDSYDTITAAACNSYVLNGQTYISSGTYVQTRINHKNCDSIITLYLTIGSQNTSSTVNKDVCDSFSMNGQTFTNSGTYTQKIQNTSGCDSNITLNLVVRKSSSKALNVSTCRPYKLNGTTYFVSGSFTQTWVNAAGCDSFIHLNLTITPNVKTVTQVGAQLTSDAVGVVYQWVDCDNGKSPISGANAKVFTATKDGNYAVIVTQNSCSDTSACYTVTGLGIFNIPLGAFKVFPNPTQGEITLVFGDKLKQGIMVVHDISGKVVMEQSNLQGDHLNVNMASLSKGIYTVQVTDKGRNYKVQVVRD